MDLIERYIDAVTELLPDDKQEFAEADLRASINELLPPEPTEDDVLEALKKMGNPRVAAGRYSKRKRYLIGPGYFDSYIAMLKLVSMILLFVMAGVTLLNWIISPPDGGIVAFFVDLFGGMVNGVLFAAAWVTVIFAALEQFEVDVPSPYESWSPADLAIDSSRIPRSDAIASIFFTVIFVALLYFRPELISFYSRSGPGDWTAVPFFELDQLSRFMPLILLSALLQIGLAIWQFIVKRWTFSLASANLVQNAVSVAVTVILLWNRTIINPDFGNEIARLTRFEAATVNRSLDIGIWVIIGLSIFGFLVDSISAYVKAARGRRHVVKPGRA